MSKISEYYREYLSTINGFEKFHNEVINMPRDEFSSATFKKIRSLASYLLLAKNVFNTREGHNYKEILGLIIHELRNQNYPLEQNRNFELEQRYFKQDCNLDSLYKSEGRMFRHLMGILAFFGIIKSYSRQKKVIKFDTCKEISLSDDNLLISILRNNWLSDNINSNDYIQNLKGINIGIQADYRPAFAILKYIKNINRPATLFELSILLGRVDKLQKENEIIERALDVAEELPIEQEDQINYIFENMNWKKMDGTYFQYAASQEPYFKFKAFILYMQNFELLVYNSTTNLIELSEYSKKILEDDIPIELLDLESLLNKIDDDEQKDTELMDLVINKRSNQINNALQNNTLIVEKINKRALRPCNIEYDRHGKKKRNRLIAELAKLLADYTCEATNRKTFKMPNGKYYVEAHHLIEFSNENGPDITENLIILGPEKHRLIHLACKEEIEDLYNHLKTNGVINIERFKRMHTIYNCLTSQHIQILADKKLISSIDKEELLELIAQ